MANADYTASASSISTLIHRLLPSLSFNLTAADVPDVNLSSNTDSNPFAKFIAEAGEAELQSWGVIANTFLELEIDHISQLESFYSKGAKVWCVGPTFLYGPESTTNHHKDDNSVSLMKWLDGRAAEASESAIYAAFGSQAVPTDAEMEAMALGLEDSGCPFVLVIRSNIGGFLSHCGWKSIMESLAAVPILAWPMISEQKLNAKYKIYLEKN